MPGPTAGAAYEAHAGVYERRRFTRRDRRRERRQARRVERRYERAQRQQAAARRLARVAKGYAQRPPTVEQATAMLQTLAPRQRENIGAALAERYALTEQKLPKRLYQQADRRIELGDRQREAMTQDLEDLPGWVQTAVDVAGFAVPIGPVGTGLKLGTAAAGVAAKAAAKKAVEEAAERAAGRIAAGEAKVAAAAGKTGARAAAERAAGRSLQAAGKAGSTKAGRGATVAARGAGKVAKTGGKVASAPIRHPIKTAKYSALAQAPVAIQSGDPGGALRDLVETGGVAGDALRAVGDTAASLAPGQVAENIVRDAFDLPAAIVPSTYMGVAGLVEAAQGDSDRLEQLWEEYKDTGVIPALAGGDVGEALERVKEHPLFGALEVSGAASVAGRTAGAVARSGRLGARVQQAGSMERKPLDLGKGIEPEPRQYSRDLGRKAVQVLADQRRARRSRRQGDRNINNQPARRNEREAILQSRIDRLVGQEEGARRGPGRAAAQAFTEDVRKGKAEGTTGKLRGAEREAVGLTLRGIVKSPETFRADLARYVARLDKSHAKLTRKLKNAESRKERLLIKSRMRANRDLRAKAEEARASGDPRKVVAAARALAARRNEQEGKLAEKTGEAEKLEQARLFPAARVHLGAKYRKPNVRGHKERVKKAEQQGAAALSGRKEAERQVGKAKAALKSADAKLREKPDDKRLRASVDAKRQALARAEATLKFQRKRAKQAGKELKAAKRALKTFKPGQKRLVDKEGNPLNGQRLRDELRAAGVDSDNIAFVTNAPGARGAGSFYRPLFPDRQTLSGKRTSGKAILEGTFDASWEATAEQLIRSQGINDALTGFDRIVGAIAVRGDKLRYKDWTEAQDAARHPEAHGLPSEAAAGKLRPLRIAPLRAGSKEIERATDLLDSLDSSAYRAAESLGENVMKAAGTKGDGPVVLVTENQFKRLEDHFRAATTTRKVMQVVNQGFKGVVLPLSPKWYAGNFLDVSMRSMFDGTGLYGRNAALGRKFLKHIETLDPALVKRETGLTPKEFADRVRAGLVPGGLFGHQATSNVHREAIDFAGKYLGPTARAMAMVRRTPGPKQVINLWVRARDAALRFNEFAFERQAQYAILGKTVRRDARQTISLMNNALRVSDKAMADLAKGLLKTPNQVRYAKAIERTLGQWTGNSPEMRAFLVDYAPFGMWARAATKYVAFTLPVHHPIKVALGASLVNATEEERQALGLTQFGAGRLPTNVQGAIPLPNGGFLATQNYTSFGFFSDYQKSLSDMILPQFPLQELAGFDWTGTRLEDSEGHPLGVDGRVAAVFNSSAEAFLPFYARAKQVADKGPSALLPWTTYDEGLADYLRSKSTSQQIEVPDSGSSSAEDGWTTESSSTSDGWNTGSTSTDGWNTGA